MVIDSRRIEFIGPLGIGKTALLRACGPAQTGAVHVFERLEPIARDRKYWQEGPSDRAFFIQSVYYLNSCRQILRATRSGRIIVCDFSLWVHHYAYSREARAAGFLDSLQHRRLHSLRNALERLLPPLCGVVLCEAPDETIVQRIAERGRGGEDTDAGYISRLSEACRDLTRRVRVPILTLDLTQPIHVIAPIVSEFVAAQLKQRF